MRHAVQERDGLVRVHGDEHVSGVRVDVVVREAGVQQAQQRGLVETVQLSRILGNTPIKIRGRRVERTRDGRTCERERRAATVSQDLRKKQHTASSITFET